MAQDWTIANQANAIKQALSSWASDEAGIAFVASDMAHMWHLAYTNNRGVRAFICYSGEEIRGDFGVAAILGRVDRQWTVMLTRGRGFNSERGDSLSNTAQNNRPFYDLIDEARNLIRAMQLDATWTERPVDFKSIKPVSLPNAHLIDAYSIEFSIGTQLPQIVAGDYSGSQETQVVNA